MEPTKSFAPVDDLFKGKPTAPQKKRIAYMYDDDIRYIEYTPRHVMKPIRIRITHSVITSYGLKKEMEVYRARPLSDFEMTKFHTDEYIDFLKNVTPETLLSDDEKDKFGIDQDCPIFEELFQFCQSYASQSVEGAARLNTGRNDIAINWSGGLHHAKSGNANGFCYVNDIVLAILELLRVHTRVLYVDIDYHHGDGVEQAFYTTDRVMTVSFHDKDSFPYTGKLNDTGFGKGRKYAVNVPLGNAINDEAYKQIFEPIMTKVLEVYRPDAIVLQCGADSLSGDRLGHFNLTMRGHANCVRFIKEYNVPTLVLGGGGYTVANVARTWAFETGVLLDKELDLSMPHNDYYAWFGPKFELDVRASNKPDSNSPEFLQELTTAIIENLRGINFAPSVQMMDVPRQSMGTNDEDEAEMDDADEDENKDIRLSQRQRDKMVARDNDVPSGKLGERNDNLGEPPQGQMPGHEDGLEVAQATSTDANEDFSVQDLSFESLDLNVDQDVTEDEDELGQ